MSIKELLNSNEILMLRSSVREFAKAEIEPYYSQWEKDGIIPKEIWKKLGNNGFLLIDIPEKYGGLGAPYLFSAVIVEELSKMNFNSLAANLAVHDQIVAHYIHNYGTEEQKSYYLPKMAKGELIGAIAMTEPHAGSDLQGIKTHAKYDDEKKKYILNGQKTFITNGQQCDFLIVAARTDFQEKPSKGISLFLVDTNLEGFNRGKNLEKIGLHACDTSELFFEDIELLESAVLGEKNRGFEYLMNELPRERLILAVSAVGSMEGILERTIQYVKERELFGKTLDQFQNTKFVLAELKTLKRIHRSFVNECIELMMEDKLDTVTASMAKLSCTEAQGKVIDQCLQLHGGYGYMVEYPVSRAYVDARVQRIYGGTSEVMKLIISKNL